MSDIPNDDGEPKAKRRGRPPTTGTAEEGRALGDWYGKIIADRNPKIGLAAAFEPLEGAFSIGRLGDAVLPEGVVIPEHPSKAYKVAALIAFAAAYSAATSAEEDPAALAAAQARMGDEPPTEAEGDAAEEDALARGEPEGVSPMDRLREVLKAGRPPPPVPPSGEGGAGEPEEPPLDEHYRAIVGEAIRFSLGGHAFMDAVYPLLRRIMTVHWKRPDGSDGATQKYLNYPVRLNNDGLELLKGKISRGRGFDEMQHHIAIVLRHFLDQGGDNTKALHTGVVSRFSNIIWATFILPPLIAQGRKDQDEKPIVYPLPPVLPENGILLPSRLVKAWDGTNDLVKAWSRFTKPPRDPSLIVKRVAEPVAKERIEAGKANGAMVAIQAIEDYFFDAVAQEEEVARLPAGELADISAEPFIMVGKRDGSEIVVSYVLTKGEFEAMMISSSNET